MSLISIIVALVVIGLVLWLVDLLPIDGTIKQIIKVLTIVFVILWILQGFGWFGLGAIRIG